MNALTDIVDTTNKGYIDFQTFRAKLPKALNTSLTFRRVPSKVSVAVDILAAFLAVTNLAYVIHVSCTKELYMTRGFAVIVGAIITIAGMIDLLIRINPFQVLPHSSSIKFDSVFDTMACVAALFSIYGELCCDASFMFV